MALETHGWTKTRGIVAIEPSAGLFYPKLGIIRAGTCIYSGELDNWCGSSELDSLERALLLAVIPSGPGVQDP